MILTGGKIITVDKDFSIREALAIKDGRFLAVGSSTEIAQLKGPSTRVIELEGRTVMPGLIDTHLHQLGAGLNMKKVDQMLLIWMELTRQTEGAGILGPEQKITREEAIRFHTIHGAYASFEENRKGSIEPGKLADRIVLSGDILTVPEDDIPKLRVLMTLVGGSIVHEAESR